ncbi:hypothetical protein MTR_6g060500 [Medicago truncatula]|uniref:Uncharacterized protein n=1 Tax=Medicago truncatula TaxID=3880 RepID=G7KNB3_MEDTR|nr:hypothetical protein MTR_6g060500 [Medicago truncatula]
MNEINADNFLTNEYWFNFTPQRLLLASEFKGEADKVLIVKKAEAEAESMFLGGVGVARQRQAITDVSESLLFGNLEAIWDYIFKCKDEFVGYNKVMGEYGYSIEYILMVDIIPDPSVQRAMNEINAGNPCMFVYCICMPFMQFD